MTGHSPDAATSDLRARIVDELTEARTRTLGLTTLDDDDLQEQVSPLMSPLVWDLAHIGNYEHQWLVRPFADDPHDAHLDDLYDAFRHPRRTRSELDILAPDEARAYVAAVRDRTLDVLDDLDLGEDADNRLLRAGFVHGMVIQHEHQHCETMVATHQLRPQRAAVWDHTAELPTGSVPSADEILVEASAAGHEGIVLGTDREPWAYDNERPAVQVHLDDFWLDTTPVTNAAYVEFVDAGGYEQADHWTREGWKWRLEADLEAPEFWRRDGDAWCVRRFGREVPLALEQPVQHVGWHEARAFAAWRGKRLPTEAEWEAAARWHPDGGVHRYPWGEQDPTSEHANLGQRHDGPAPVGAYPYGVSRWGHHQLIGDVWEWTSSPFGGHPGFESFPYPEYSEGFFGDEYLVLKGGSWAAHPAAVRASFRNWDYPIRRQIFSGFRCARSG